MAGYRSRDVLQQDLLPWAASAPRRAPTLLRSVDSGTTEWTAADWLSDHREHGVWQVYKRSYTALLTLRTALRNPGGLVRPQGHMGGGGGPDKRQRAERGAGGGSGTNKGATCMTYGRTGQDWAGFSQRQREKWSTRMQAPHRWKPLSVSKAVLLTQACHCRHKVRRWWPKPYWFHSEQVLRGDILPKSKNKMSP